MRIDLPITGGIALVFQATGGLGEIGGGKSTHEQALLPWPKGILKFDPFYSRLESSHEPPFDPFVDSQPVGSAGPW